MKAKLISRILYLVTSMMIIQSCILIESSPEEIASMLEVNFLSSDEIKFGESLSVSILNTSNYCVVFPPNYDAKVFVKVEDKWIEVSNLANVLTDKENILLPGGGIESIDFVDVLPDLSSYRNLKPSEAYVILTGHVCNDEKISIVKKINFVIFS